MSSDRSPSNNFTDKVMKDVKKRPRKIGLWNLVYIAPIAISIALLITPTTRQAILNTTDTQHSAVSSAQNDVESMQELVDELEEFSESELNTFKYASAE